MSTGMALNKSMAEKESDKRKALLDEMYGYSDDVPDEEKNELMEMFKAYMEHRKNKQQKPLTHVLGR